MYIPIYITVKILIHSSIFMAIIISDGLLCAYKYYIHIHMYCIIYYTYLYDTIRDYHQPNNTVCYVPIQIQPTFICYVCNISDFIKIYVYCVIYMCIIQFVSIITYKILFFLFLLYTIVYNTHLLYIYRR